MDQLNKNNLIKAIQNTFKRRETNFDIEQFNDIVSDLIEDNNMNNLWDEYVLKNPYAKNINFNDTIKAIKEIIDILESELVGV